MIVQPNFVHLNVRSDYSMNDGLSKVHNLIKCASSFSMPALALTDFNNLFGLIKFYDYSHKLGIKPIIGSSFLIQSESNQDTDFYELLCLVSNHRGYRNLIEMISKSYKYKSNFNYPVIQQTWLSEHNEGLILISGGCNGDIGQFLLKGERKKIEQRLYFYNKYFLNRYYIELVRTDRINEESYVQLAIELARIKGLPVVATNAVRFVNKKDFHAHNIRVAIHDGVILDKIQQEKKYSVQQFMKNAHEMHMLFHDIPESLINSIEIAKRCNYIINLNGSFLPKFPTGNVSVENFLIKRAQEGLEERLIHLYPDVRKRCIKRSIYDTRLNHELNMINKMQFPSYFLIVMEFIQWAKDNHIPVGPGRGSGASSLVAYALRITELDPIKFDLLFERFLNPERVSMPDLDIDFCMEHRDLVIDHVVQTYGADAVSQIITFGTMAAKAAVRDVGRALGYPYNFVNRIAKLIPLELGITLSKACFTVSQLKFLYNSDIEVKVLIDLACQLEGIIRNVSKHAGGVVIAPNKITDFSPLYYDNNHNHPMTQFDKDDIERIGLIKFDFLGLRTLTIINRALNMINNNSELKCNSEIVDINLISLKDWKTFQLLKTAETTGIFQLESFGIKKLINRLQPDRFDDLIALIALFRPGPLQSGMVDNFINRKRGQETISYPDYQWEHDALRPILESTYGIILYQEQVMQIAQIMAGYTLGKADLLRRAIGKKKSEDMAEHRSIFINGAISNGFNKTLSEKIFDLMEKFAGYGFNKSHSAAYALISYQTLWLKAHYPAEFMSAILSSDMDNIDRIINLLSECRRMGLKVLPPDINHSQYYFYVDKNKNIVYGIGAIKGIGKSSIDAIIDSRNRHGKFKELFDFCVRMDLSKINHRTIEKLIFSGSFDSFGIHRSKLLIALDKIIYNAIQYVKQKNSKQINMFTSDKDVYNTECSILNSTNGTACLQWSDQVLLKKEKETLGLYLTNHPVNQYQYEIQKYVPNIIDIKHILLKKNNNIIYTFGLIVSIRIKLSEKGNYVLFGVLEDNSGRLDIVVFAELMKTYQSILKEDNCIFIKGILKYSKKFNMYKVVVQELQDINSLRKCYVSNLSIIIDSTLCNQELLDNIYNFLKPNCNGMLPVFFIYQVHGVNVKLSCGSEWNINLTDQLLVNLRNLIGYDQVQLVLN